MGVGKSFCNGNYLKKFVSQGCKRNAKGKPQLNNEMIFNASETDFTPFFEHFWIRLCVFLAKSPIYDECIQAEEYITNQC